MNVLHYSFSLSACPKCHLLICKHTSLADLDFNSDQKQTECNNSSQQQLSDGTNVYIFPSTTANNRYSWTTFGTNSNHNLSPNNQTICENIPFANENILHSSLTLTPTVNPLIQIQSERINQEANGQKSIYLPKSLSLTESYSSSPIIFLLIFLLILSFLITNTIDIVLIYIYYHTNFIYLISFLLTIILCDMIFWINNLIQSNSISFYFLLIPFSIRFYLLYKLLELLIILFDKNMNKQIYGSFYKVKKQNLYQNLTLFYLIHTGFLTFINLYIWSNNFQFSGEFFLNMEYFIPQWIINKDLTYWEISHPILGSSLFVLISILYNLIINYSLLSTFLIYKRFKFLIILSQICLIIPRIYTLIFLFHLNTWWLIITLFVVHFILIIILIFDRSKFQHKRNTIFLQMIFTLITHQSIDDLSINALISLENIVIFVHQFYFEIFSVNHQQQTILRFIVFISILISLQILGFIFNILLKYILYRKKTITKKCII